MGPVKEEGGTGERDWLRGEEEALSEGLFGVPDCPRFSGASEHREPPKVRSSSQVGGVRRGRVELDNLQAGSRTEARRHLLGLLARVRLSAAAGERRPGRGPGADQVQGLGDSRPWLTRRSEPWQPHSPAASRRPSSISDLTPRRLCARWRLPVLAWIWLPRLVPPSAPGAVRPGAPRRPGALIFPSQVPSLCRPRPAIHSTSHPQNTPPPAGSGKLGLTPRQWSSLGAPRSPRESRTK